MQGGTTFDAESYQGPTKCQYQTVKHTAEGKKFFLANLNLTTFSMQYTLQISLKKNFEIAKPLVRIHFPSLTPQGVWGKRLI